MQGLKVRRKGCVANARDRDIRGIIGHFQNWWQENCNLGGVCAGSECERCIREEVCTQPAAAGPAEYVRDDVRLSRLCVSDKDNRACGNKRGIEMG